MQKKLIIIGGGAAGFFCAINVADFNAHIKICIVEKQTKVLQKVKVSGGGRCNVTNACMQTSLLLQKYPRGKNFLKKSFQQFSTQDTKNWFENRGVPLIAEKDGRVFPTSNTSQTIIDTLLQEVAKNDIELKLKTEIVSVKKQSNRFILETKQGQILESDFLFMACGGFPKIEQYDWIKKLGHTVETPVPSLFTFNLPQHSINKLMGVAIENVVVKIVGTKFQEEGALLITHWGFSGPAILKLSAWAAVELATKNYQFSIIINWLAINENELRNQWNTIRDNQKNGLLKNKNPFGLPNRFWDFLLILNEINPETKWSELVSKEQNKLIHCLTTHEFIIKGKTTFKEEFVTCGGINLDEIEATTLQSKLVPNLFFGGEIINVDGITGGFNFQNAWTTGYIAAKTIAQI